VIAKRKGDAARRGLKEAWSKRTSRCTRTGSEAGSDWTSWRMTTKSISIKGVGCKFGNCVRKAVELTSGDLTFVVESLLRAERSALTGRQKSAERVVGVKTLKARTVPARG
jgi:hypothetical protein